MLQKGEKYIYIYFQCFKKILLIHLTMLGVLNSKQNIGELKVCFLCVTSPLHIMLTNSFPHGNIASSFNKLSAVGISMAATQITMEQYKRDLMC